MKKKFGFVLAAAILLAGCGQKKETTTTTARPVKTTIVESRSIIRKDFSGIVEAVEYVKLAFRVNDIMKAFFKGLKVDLVDFKLEFGRTSGGTIILADEISPDTCRFWDSETHEKLDKDRFRRDLGGVEDAYKEMMKRILG